MFLQFPSASTGSSLELLKNAALADVEATDERLTTTTSQGDAVMATINSSRPARPRARSSGNQVRTHPPVVAPTTRCIPAKAERVIQRVCRRLKKALAVLTCLREAAEHEAEVDLADVAAVAGDLVDKALYELDLVGFSGETDNSDA